MPQSMSEPELLPTPSRAVRLSAEGRSSRQFLISEKSPPLAAASR